MAGCHAQAQLERVLCVRWSTVKRVWPWHPGTTEVVRQNSLGFTDVRFEPPEIFAARAWVLDESAETLTHFLDIPWCKADLFYIQKLACCLEARNQLPSHSNTN